MSILWEKLYYRVQTLFAFLQKKLLVEKLRASNQQKYRLDLLKTLYPIKATITEEPSVLIDIGANQGEFAQLFSHIFALNKLICVEPNKQLNTAIMSNLGSSDLIIINKAISNTIGTLEFHFHSDTQMSSLFSSSEAMIKRDFGDDDPAKIRVEKVQVTTLNSIYEDNAPFLDNQRVFLKIDTQGNELEVIQGGLEVLKKIKYCLLEYMFQSPYEKQYPFEDILTLMSSTGFTCKGPMHTSQRTTGEIGAVLFLFENTNV